MKFYKDRGSFLVELAIVVPITLYILLGLFEMQSMYETKQKMDQMLYYMVTEMSHKNCKTEYCMSRVILSYLDRTPGSCFIARIMTKKSALPAVESEQYRTCSAGEGTYFNEDDFGTTKQGIESLDQDVNDTAFVIDAYTPFGTGAKNFLAVFPEKVHNVIVY